MYHILRSFFFLPLVDFICSLFGESSRCGHNRYIDTEASNTSLPCSKMHFNLGHTFTFTFILLIITTLQVSFAVPSPLQNTVVYPNVHHHRHYLGHQAPPLSAQETGSSQKQHPMSANGFIHESTAENDSSFGCRRLRLLGVNIKKCVEQMVSDS